jgi:hypothetical protein
MSNKKLDFIGLQRFLSLSLKCVFVRICTRSDPFKSPLPYRSDRLFPASWLQPEYDSVTTVIVAYDRLESHRA